MKCKNILCGRECTVPLPDGRTRICLRCNRFRIRQTYTIFSNVGATRDVRDVAIRPQQLLQLSPLILTQSDTYMASSTVSELPFVLLHTINSRLALSSSSRTLATIFFPLHSLHYSQRAIQAESHDFHLDQCDQFQSLIHRAQNISLTC